MAMDIISKRLINVVYSNIAPKLQKLSEMWLELGEGDDEQEAETEQLTDAVEHILSRVLDDKLNHVDGYRKDLLEEAESYGLNLIELGRMLDVPIIEPDESLRVIQLRDYLKSRVLELEAIRAERAAKLEELRCQEKKLANFLGQFPLKISANVLTQKTLDDVRRNVETLQTEKMKRKESFVTMRKKILLLMDDLQHTPDTSLERDIVSDEEDAFLLTEVNMNATKAILDKFERDIKNNEVEAKKLRDGLQLLWTVLQVESSDQDSFLKKHSGHRPSTVRALREELKRCNDLKMKNARQYVEKVRIELKNLWDRCYYSRAQRKTFIAFTSDDFTEELVDIHDIELQRLKEIRDEGEEIFIKLEKRAELWNRMKELENKASDPKRLLNRGGQLLKEEKERKRLQTLISKLEADLAADVTNWETEKRKKFLVYEKQIMDFISNQWEVLQQEKENDKLARHVAKGKHLDDFAGSSRNNTSRKRLLATPSKESRSKLAKITPSVKNERKPPVFSGKMSYRNVTRVTGRQPGKKERNGDETTGHLRVMATGSNMTWDFSSTSQLSTYSEFQDNVKPRSQVGLASTMTMP